MTGRARSRLFYQAQILVAGGPVVVIDEELPFNATLLQFHAVMSAWPAFDENFILRKGSVLGPNWDIDLRVWNPGTEQASSLLCNEHFEFRKGDHCIVIYPNSGAVTVGIEVIFGEAD